MEGLSAISARYTSWSEARARCLLCRQQHRPEQYLAPRPRSPPGPARNMPPQSGAAQYRSSSPAAWRAARRRRVFSRTRHGREQNRRIEVVLRRQG